MHTCIVSHIRALFARCFSPKREKCAVRGVKKNKKEEQKQKNLLALARLAVIILDFDIYWWSRQCKILRELLLPPKDWLVVSYCPRTTFQAKPLTWTQRNNIRRVWPFFLFLSAVDKHDHERQEVYFSFKSNARATSSGSPQLIGKDDPAYSLAPRQPGFIR